MLCGTTIAGTGLTGIAEAARKLGFEAEWKQNAKLNELSNALKRGIPVITFVDARLLHDIEMPFPVGHAIVIFAIHAKKIFTMIQRLARNKVLVANYLSRLGKI